MSVPEKEMLSEGNVGGNEALAWVKGDLGLVFLADS